jgi:hypothetical protein
MGHLRKLGVESSEQLKKRMKQQNIKHTMRGMKTYQSAQAMGFFDVELRVQWLEAKGNPLGGF